MPSYYFLNTRFLQQPTFDSLLTTINKNKIILDHNNIWQKILDQANQIFNDLKKENLPVKNRTEILALISYLQSILSSDEKLKRDSIKNEQRKKEQIIWDNLVLDSNSIIYKTAKDKNSIELGKVIYKSTCVVCHGESGGGLIGPNLTDDNWLHGSSVFDIAKTIINGVPEKGMMAWRNNYNPEEVGQLVAYITSLKGSNPENAKIKQGIKE
jgi:cytochrome c5